MTIVMIITILLYIGAAIYFAHDYAAIAAYGGSPYRAQLMLYFLIIVSSSLVLVYVTAISGKIDKLLKKLNKDETDNNA